MTTIVWKDGRPLKELDDENAAFAWLLSHQGQSVDYATKHGGYEIAPASSYGCGDDSCVSCYPFVRSCEHGVKYDEPIANGDELPECDHELRFVVDDRKDVPIGGTIPIINSFETEDEAAEYIGTLPEYETGRYGIIDMEERGE